MTQKPQQTQATNANQKDKPEPHAQIAGALPDAAEPDGNGHDADAKQEREDTEATQAVKPWPCARVYYWINWRAVNAALTLAATIVIAWFTYSQSASTEKQWDATKAQNDIMIEQNKYVAQQSTAAVEQLKLAQDTSKQTDESLELTRLSRAALVTMGPPQAAIATIGTNAGKEVLVNIHVKNVGQLPARVTGIKFKAFNAPYGSNVSEFVNARTGWQHDASHLVFPPGIETLIGFTAEGKLFAKDIETGSRRDAMTLYVCVDITYDDILEILGRTRTVFYFSAADGAFLTDANYSVMDQTPSKKAAK